MIQEAIEKVFRGSPEDKDPTEALDALIQARVGEHLQRLGLGATPPPKASSKDEPQENGRGSADAAIVTAIVEDLEAKGLSKTSLATRVLQSEIHRARDGRLYGTKDGKTLPYSEFIGEFLSENPELLPPRIAGGTGTTRTDAGQHAPLSLDDIRPGMDPELQRQAWAAVSRLTGRI